MTIFTQTELRALKAFYARVPARQIRPLWGNTWPLVAKHRALPKALYEAVKTSLAQLPDEGDPIAPDAPLPVGAQEVGERS